MLIGAEVTGPDDLYFGEKCAGHGIPAWRKPGPNCRLPMTVGDVAMVFDQGDAEVDRVILWHRHCIEATLRHPTYDAEGYLGETCQDCRRRIVEPADLFVFDQGRGVYVDRDLIWHRHCILGALEYAPEEQRQFASGDDPILLNQAVLRRYPHLVEVV